MSDIVAFVKEPVVAMVLVAFALFAILYFATQSKPAGGWLPWGCASLATRRTWHLFNRYTRKLVSLSFLLKVSHHRRRLRVRLARRAMAGRLVGDTHTHTHTRTAWLRRCRTHAPRHAHIFTPLLFIGARCRLERRQEKHSQAPAGRALRAAVSIAQRSS
jgi:hypothetical protein